MTASTQRIRRVRPGDLITSEFVNGLLDRLNALESRTAAVDLLLGSLAADTRTLVALGTGFEPSAGIWLDGAQQIPEPGRRGIHLLILDANLNRKWYNVYDTIWGTAESARLATDLTNRAARGDVVVVVTRDAYAEQLQPGAKAALAAVGGAALAEPTGQTRANGAFIGIVPAHRANIRYNYLVSVVPSDGTGYGATNVLAALPSVWGVYSRPQRRFVLGGAVGPSTLAVPTIQQAAGPRAAPEDAVTALPLVDAEIAETLGAARVFSLGTLAGMDAVSLAKRVNIAQDRLEEIINEAKLAIGQEQ